MLISEVLNKYILDLDKERLQLAEKYHKYIGWYIGIPILGAILGYMLIDIPPGFFVGTMIGGLISMMHYLYQISTPFEAIKAQLKTAILKDLMHNFHPDVTYSYTQKKQDVREIAKGTGFFNANRYHEEDVLQGKYESVDFYISEVKLSRKKKKSRRTVFDGLLFKIRIPGKSFPKAKIQSRPGLITQLFNGYIENEENGFQYDTEDPTSFHETLSDLFPFFKHLIQTNKDVRISIQDNELVMFLNSDMQFLDDPKPTLKEALLSKKYIQNFAQQLNSVLFITESLANNLSPQEIEDRLELKVLEYEKIIAKAKAKA